MVLAAQPPALPQCAAALLLGGVGGQQAAGSPLCQVVITLPQLARTSLRKGRQHRRQLHHAGVESGGGGGRGLAGTDYVCF